MYICNICEKEIKNDEPWFEGTCYKCVHKLLVKIVIEHKYSQLKEEIIKETKE